MFCYWWKCREKNRLIWRRGKPSLRLCRPSCKFSVIEACSQSSDWQVYNFSFQRFSYLHHASSIHIKLLNFFSGLSLLGCFANIVSHALTMAGWYTGRGGIEIDWDLTISSLGCFLAIGGKSKDDWRKDTICCLGSGGEYVKDFCGFIEGGLLTSPIYCDLL